MQLLPAPALFPGCRLHLVTCLQRTEYRREKVPSQQRSRKHHFSQVTQANVTVISHVDERYPEVM